MADYEIPKYYPEMFSDKNRALNASIDNFILKKLTNLQVCQSDKEIILCNIAQFGTSPVRKEIAKKYVSLYLEPLIQFAQKKFGTLIYNSMENTLKAYFLLRLLGVYNISKMEPLDQVKVFGLLYKTVGTPISHENGHIEATTVAKFLDSL